MKKNIIVRAAAFLLCMALVAGIYTFLVIPSVRKEEKEIYEEMLAAETQGYVTVLTYNGDTPLLSDTIVTEAIASHFVTVQMPSGCVTSDYVSDFEDICGLQLKYAICRGQQVSYQNFKEFLKDAEGNERLKEFPDFQPCCGTGAAGAVCGYSAQLSGREHGSRRSQNTDL